MYNFKKKTAQTQLPGKLSVFSIHCGKTVTATLCKMNFEADL